MFTIKLLYHLLFYTSGQYGSSGGGCSISTNRDLPNPQGLLLSPYTLQILYPEVGDKLLLDPGEEIRIACPGGYLKTKGKSFLTTDSFLERLASPVFPTALQSVITRSYDSSVMCSCTYCTLWGGNHILLLYILMYENCVYWRGLSVRIQQAKR